MNAELQEWQKVLKAWWLEANAGNNPALGMSMELYQASCALIDALEKEPPEMTVTMPPYYEDDEVCGYCNRQPNTKHEAWCRQ